MVEYIDGYLLESGGDTEIYHESEMMSLLDEVLTDEDKIKVIDKFPSSISLSDKNYSTAVIDYILQNKVDEEDLQFFISNYKILSMSTKSIFRKIFADYISEFLEEIDSVDKSLLYEVIEDTAIDIEYRRLVLANYIDDFSYPELLTLLNSVRLTEIITSLTDNKKPKVEITGYNELILEYLKTNKKIASYHQEGDSYRIYSRKHR